MNVLRKEQEDTAMENETLKGEIKSLSEKITGQEHEIKSLLNNNNLLEKELQDAQGPIKEAKATANDSTKLREENEGLKVKVDRLEAEADLVGKHISDLTEKYDQELLRCCWCGGNREADVLILAGYKTRKPNSATLKTRFVASSQNRKMRIKSTKSCARLITRSERSWKTSSRRLATSERLEYCT